ncbi:MAG: Gfo/Idh/MocA family oxidoreductase [Phycisphaerae bacterium]|nr:Gfo/Idh/MocA family oxidoreductase [Phycisphaerae bacterium]
MTTIRIGIIGAGGNTRSRHIPGLRAVEGVRIVCVANRSLESSQKAARELDIPRAHARWQDVIDDPEVDAVCIGTWPYLHAAATCAALAAGKHVLCEARMACDADEARLMLASSQHSDKVAMLVPSPFGLKGDRVVREMIDSGFLGEIRELYIRGLSAQLADATAPLHWRQRAELSGVNILALGIMNETVQRWFGRADSVVAQTGLFVPRRRDPATGLMRDVDIPDSVAVLARQADGANAVYHLSGVAHFGGGNRIEAYGSAGTLIYNFGDDTILAGRAGEKELKPVPIPPDKAVASALPTLPAGWRVEADFIESIRTGKPVTLTSFADGLKYMQFTEAVRRSADTGRRVPVGEV